AWDGFKPFTVTNITEETDMIKSFTVTSDEIDLSQFIPGQYITVDISSEKLPYRAKRHYSIVDGDKDFLTFGVRRHVTEEHEGEISTVLHAEVNGRDTLLLSAPVGGFGLANKANKQLFLGSGVGVTRLASLYQEELDTDLTATFLQSTSNAQNVAFEEKLEVITAKSAIAQFDKHFGDQVGFIDAEQLKQYLDGETEVYVCGGNSFLKAMITELQKLE